MAGIIITLPHGCEKLAFLIKILSHFSDPKDGELFSLNVRINRAERERERDVKCALRATQRVRMNKEPK